MKIQVSTRDMLSKIVENTVFVLLGVCVTPVVNFEVERERERDEGGAKGMKFWSKLRLEEFVVRSIGGPLEVVASLN